MDSFNVGEVVWAKIRGYPWWPAMITGTEDENREKKYVVSFIGDNTHANLQKKYLNKFEKEFKTHSNTKKKDLLGIIKKAKDIHDNKMKNDERSRPKGKKDININKSNNNDEQMLSEISIISTQLLPFQLDNNSFCSKEKKKEEKIFEGNEAILDNNTVKKNKSHTLNFNSYQVVNGKEKGQSFLKRKTKRNEEKNGINIINKIIHYLGHIVKLLYNKRSDKVNEDKACSMKVMNFLKDFKMSEPIDFLKVSDIFYYYRKRA